MDMSVVAKSPQIQALIAKAKKDMKPGGTLQTEDVVSLAPFNVLLEYRTGAAGGGVHEKEDEIFYCLEGEGTMVTGGHLVPGPGKNPNPPPAANPNMAYNVSQGGTPHLMTKGDILIVAHGMPHYVSGVKGHVIFLSMHLPRPELYTPPAAK